MDELFSYSYSDLLMFSRQTYTRLFELYNQALWPAHLPVMLLTLWCVAATRRGDAQRARRVSLLLAALWGVISGVFFLHYYATIHLAAPWFALGFAVQGALFLWSGAFKGQLRYAWDDSINGFIGAYVLLFAILFVPLSGLLAGRPWQGIEMFGLTPDPTALGTLGLLLMVQGKTPWRLLPLPLLWCVYSSLTHLAMVMKG